MQAIAPVTNADLLAPGQRPRMKLWINVGGWQDITTLPDPVTGVPKNYLKDISFSSGGARMTPNPIAGEFSAVISNEGNIFHPKHPTSPYATYFQAGREIKIELGGNYAIGGVKLWQRIIGHMDEPEFASDTFELTIKGLDYMKVLSDTKFNKELSTFATTPIDNYWGDLATFNSVTTEGALGAELYLENDAMEIGAGEAGVVMPPWTKSGIFIGFSAFGDVGGGSVWVGNAGFLFIANNWVRNLSVCTPPNLTQDTLYKFEYKYQRVDGTLGATFKAYQATGICDSKREEPTDALWHQEHFYFKALETGPLSLEIMFHDVVGQWKVDQFSIKQLTPAPWHRYDMSGLGCTGIYYVTLDGVPVWPGKQKGEGWYYDEDNEQFYFDEDKNIDAGVNNLLIYYYTAQAPEDVLADILVKSALYANRAAALAAMGGPATGVSVDRVWFNAGATYISAIKKLCERCNYRFYFDHSGLPVFVTAPTAGAPVFTTFLPQHFTAPKLYQDRNEIRNRIVIEGEKRAELTGWEDNMPSELKDEASDPGSITAYGEHTKSIRNHLFQTQASITAMCATLLAAYKNPKWYFDYDTPYNAVPLVLGDTVLVQELLDIVLPVAQRYFTHTCLIRDADVSRYNVTYKCEMVGGCMLIPHEGDVEEKWEDASESDRMYAYVGNCDANSFVSDGSPLKIVCECE